MNISVEEFTSPVPVTIEVSATIDEAMSLMQEHQIRHLPVVKGNEVKGIVSERDIATHYGKQWTKMLCVGDIMNDAILSVYCKDNLGSVAFQLSERKVGSAIVLDQDNKLYGIFTTTDALNALVEILYPDANERSDLNLEN
jgi:acetoin utilization protein AcuB